MVLRSVLASKGGMLEDLAIAVHGKIELGQAKSFLEPVVDSPVEGTQEALGIAPGWPNRDTRIFGIPMGQRCGSNMCGWVEFRNTATTAVNLNTDVCCIISPMKGCTNAHLDTACVSVTEAKGKDGVTVSGASADRPGGAIAHKVNLRRTSNGKRICIH